MKYSIAVKFVAIILCAASLVGILACAGGILALTETGMYSMSAEQAKEKQIRLAGDSFAKDEAVYYCSEVLGGMPKQLLDQKYPVMNSTFNFNHAGYALKDAEGNLLAGNGALNAGTAANTYTFRVSGKYLHLVSATPTSQLEIQRAAQSNPEALVYSGEDGYYFYSMIPVEGARVSSIRMDYLTEDYEAEFDSYHAGFVFFSAEGDLIFRIMDGGIPEGLIRMAELKDENGNTLLSTSGPEGIGYLSAADDGSLILRVTPPALLRQEEAAPAETEPAETVEETTVATEVITEPTVASTEAQETVPPEVEAPQQEEAQSSEEGAKEEASSASDMPQEQQEAPAPAQEQPPQTEPAATVPPETAAPETTVPETTAEVTEAAEELGEEGADSYAVSQRPILINGKPLKNYEILRTTYYDGAKREDVIVNYVYTSMPELTVELYTEPGALQDDSVYDLVGVLQPHRKDMFLALGICALVFAASVVYLCCAAGRKDGQEGVRAGGLNRMPLDLYAVCTVLVVAAGAAVIAELGVHFLQRSLAVGIAAGLGAGFAACLAIVGFCFAAVAQLKTSVSYCLKNTLVIRMLKLAGRLIRWLWQLFLEKAVPLLVHLVKALWGLCVGAGGLLTKLRQWLHKMLSLLPVTWQWLVAGGAVILLPLFGMLVGSEGLFVLAVVADIALVIYGAVCFGTLLDTTRRMGRGDLNIQVDDKRMVGSFKDFAGELNDLADVVSVAAKQQVKSERMKTELITNVSHDIKTPLTSIVNYVDLLQKPHTDAEQEQYLEVLSRQSLQLKKLIEDLIEMSKASTGNMTVDLQVVDGVESVNQALGEYADKLERAELIPMFRHKEASVPMMADGRLVWRVLGNLLSNAVKYAMPGTRLYIDLMRAEGKVLISMKNISRDELNVDADELMERFVRGDDSRNTEGSGLGLNIAKSLMELQKGELRLLVDGDLFKVTLVFPEAQ